MDWIVPIAGILIFVCAFFVLAELFDKLGEWLERY